jgi:hypothetical protein
MSKLLILFIVSVCLPAFLSAVPTRKGPRVGRMTTTTLAPAATAAAVAAAASAFDCGPWVEQPCMVSPAGAACGVGNKVWNREGSNCPLKEKTFKCKIPCDEVGLPKLACKYVKSSWSACDPATNTKTRTLTLKIKRRGSTQTQPATNCEPTKTLTKSCTEPSNKQRVRARGQVTPA